MQLPELKCLECDVPLIGGPPWVCPQCNDETPHYFVLDVGATIDKEYKKFLTIEKVNDRYEWTFEGKVITDQKNKFQAAILVISMSAMANRMNEAKSVMAVIRGVLNEEEEDGVVERFERACRSNSGMGRGEGIRDSEFDQDS